MSDDPVLWDVEEGVGIITLNRPERHNAQDQALERKYVDVLEEADRNPDVRVVVVTGAGPAFCVGGDFDTLDEIAETGGFFDEQIPRVLTRFNASIRKPVVAAVNGAAAGSGMVYAMSADLRFASTKAKFATGFARLGLAAERGMSWYLTQIVGLGTALDLLLTGRVVLAEEALRLGLVSRVVPADELLDTTLAWAHDVIEKCSPSAMAVIKAQCYRDTSLHLFQGIAESADITFRLLGGPDLAEGIEAFREKRQAKFPPLDPPSLTAGTPFNPR
ncbi:MAG TPA: enoyl-CoA hydratase-related protein [Acidimicrobiales bacterium]|nr:enoyl-CoA hydratase-related protein [Acidimicrobiales bacterium]